jgi:hypothetical protein
MASSSKRPVSEVNNAVSASSHARKSTARSSTSLVDVGGSSVRTQSSSAPGLAEVGTFASSQADGPVREIEAPGVSSQSSVSAFLTQAASDSDAIRSLATPVREAPVGSSVAVPSTGVLQPGLSSPLAAPSSSVDGSSVHVQFPSLSASSAVQSAQVRFANGEFRASEQHLKSFIAEYARFLSPEQLLVLRDEREAWKLRGSLLAYAAGEDVTPPFSDPIDLTTSGGTDVGSLGDDSDGKLKKDPPFFRDFDLFCIPIDTENSGQSGFAATAYNKEILRWRLLGCDPRRSLALPLLLGQGSFDVDLDHIREFFRVQGGIPFPDMRHVLFQGEDPYLFTSTELLMRTGFIGDAKLFRALAVANIGTRAVKGEQRLVAAHFYPGENRDVAVRLFTQNLYDPDNGVLRGHELLSNFVAIFAGVFFCPDFADEFKKLNGLGTFVKNSMQSSQPVLLAQFFREVADCVDLLRSDLRNASATPAFPQKDGLLAPVFKERTGVGVWLAGRLVAALAMKPSTSAFRAHDAAVSYLSDGLLPVVTPPASQFLPSPTQPPTQGPCVYAYLAQHYPELKFSCAKSSCHFSHVFGGDAEHQIKTIVEGAPAYSPLGTRRPEILSALSS